MNWKPVTKEEFERFVAAYPRPLKVDCCAISEPPLVSFNDFTKGYWPKSMVARYSADWDGTQNEHQILTED